MSCPFQTAVKKEIETIKNKSHCNERCNGTENCVENNNSTKCENSVPRTNGRELSPSPKSRKESGLSLCSQASSDDVDGEGEKKLGLVGLIESVGTLLLPSVSTLCFIKVNNAKRDDNSNIIECLSE